MRRVLALIAVGFVSTIGPLRGQTAGPSFEVASVKRNVSPQAPTFFQALNDRLSVGNVPLRMLIQMAYGVDPQQISGGPDWIHQDRFDVIAKAAARFEPNTQWQEMLRTLLADRFELRVRRESKDVQGFALVRARNDGRLGPGLRAADATCAELRARPGQAPDADPCGALSLAGAQVRGSMSVHGMELRQLAAVARLDFGAPVTDETGLSGAYDWDLRWTPQAFFGRPFDRDRFPAIDPDGRRSVPRWRNSSVCDWWRDEPRST